ncbi:F0F1 ATP synthase subunit B [Winogradskyella tangerina]|uniref:F0F1 ATP synthase subunit B n=1 Tax=Winogradskyella tangerina TaxID=2023240 RepID=UPI000DBEA4AA|nr:F0F1 ATP synthase subunit B [Winogradskyella tangerina]
MEQLLENFSLDLFVKQTVLFVILIFLMAKYAWKPIINSLNEREDGIKNALDSAEKAKREMENLTADNERLLKEALVEREKLLKDAREIREQTIAKAEQEAQEKASKIIEKAQEAIEREKKVAMAELKSHVAGLSIDIAEKVVQGELSNKNKQLKLVEDMLVETTLN